MLKATALPTVSQARFSNDSTLWVVAEAHWDRVVPSDHRGPWFKFRHLQINQSIPLQCCQDQKRL